MSGQVELTEAERDALSTALICRGDVYAAVERIVAARCAAAWDEGFAKAGRLLTGMDDEPWPPTPNPYRQEADRG